MNNLDPYLRYIASTGFLPNKEFVMAYDCRFFFVLSGKGVLETENQCFSLTENTLAYYPSGVPYFLKSSTDDPLTFITVNFDFTRSYPERIKTLRPVKICDFVTSEQRSTQNELGDKRFTSSFIMEHAFSLRDDFINLAALFSKNEIYTKELCNALLRYIILKISNHFCASQKEHPLVRRVMDYVEDNYTERLDNIALAAHFGYHPYYLSSLFKSHTGKTLHQHIVDTKLKYACNMLLNTDMPISEISAKCGFINTNHFSVKFKNTYKHSPSEWRKRNSII